MLWICEKADYICMLNKTHFMKKLILALLAVGTIATSNAQSGSILLYGNVGINTVKDSSNFHRTTWNASPGVGYQFNDFWTVGLNLNWAQYATKDASGDKNTTNNYYVGPFIRYAHAIGKSNIFSWYTQADVQYQGGYSTHEGDPATAKHTGFYADIFPAIGVAIGHGMALNFSVGGLDYSSDKYDGVANPTHSFGFTFGHEVNIGISKNFNCHHSHTHHEPGEEMHRRHMKDEDEDDAPKSKKKSKNRDEDE